MITIPYHYTPRKYQQEAWDALEQGSRFNVWCWSRRAGKDITAFNYAVKKMVETPLNAVLVFPNKKQGYENFWTNINGDGFKTLDHIPKSLIAKQSNSADNMKIQLKNGSTFSLLGATNPDDLRGANGKIYILSEFVDLPSEVLDIIEPITENNGGQIIIQSTPKIDGRSGATFKKLFDYAKDNKNSYALRITAEEYLDKERLDSIKERYVAKNGNDFVFQQEFMCDWGQVSETSYYGQSIQASRDNDRVGRFPYNNEYPVYTSWDLGMSDSTSIIFFQYYDNRVYVIDSYETNDIGISTIIKFLNTKPYNYGWHFFPHDASVRDIEANARINTIQDAGLINSSILTRESIDTGIERVIKWFPKIYFNKNTTLSLLDKLILYKRKYNPITGDYIGPEHKTASHSADALRYMLVAIDQEFNQETCQMLFQQDDSFVDDEQLTRTTYY